MRKFKKNTLLFCIASLSFVATTAAAKFPDGPVTIIVPYPAGGVTDVYARTIGKKLSEMWDKPVIIDNKAGGGSMIGTAAAARSNPDGYTILLASYGYTSNQVLKKELPYDPTALTPLLLIGNSTNIFYLNKHEKFNTLQEIIDWAKKNPKELTLASSGNGSSPHIAAELFAREVGVEITHVPYRGTAPAMNDVISGRVMGIFDGPSSMVRVEGGLLKPLAAASESEHPHAKGVPTFRSENIDLIFGSYFGFLVPTKTPENIQEFLFDSIEKAIQDPQVSKVIAETGLRVSDGSQQDFKNFMDAELKRLTELVNMEGVSLVVD